MRPVFDPARTDPGLERFQPWLWDLMSHRFEGLCLTSFEILIERGYEELEVKIDTAELRCEP